MKNILPFIAGALLLPFSVIAQDEISFSNIIRIESNGDTVTSGGAVVGRSGAQEKTFVTVASFNISEITDEISSGGSIFFDATYTAFNSGGPDLTLYVFGKSGTGLTSADGSVVGFASPTTFSAGSYSAAPQELSFDVTTIVQSLADDYDYLGFRLESQYGLEVGPANNENMTFGQLGSADMTLRVVPEPGTYALLAGLASMCFILIRRQRS